MSISMTDTELSSIVAEVERELGSFLKSESQRLTKAKPDEMDPEASAAPAAEASPPAPPAAEGSATSPEASEAAPGEAPGEVGEVHEESPGEIEAAASPEELQAEYEKLPPEELKNHYLACKQAIFKLMGQGDEGSAPAPGAGAPPAPAMKMELDAVAPTKADAGKDRLEAVAVTKSEPSLEMEALKGQVEMLTKAVHALAGQPIRKAVTNMDFVAKTPEPAKEVAKLNKAEVTARLTAASARPDLKKSDRELINGYYEGFCSIDKIAHLLTDSK